MRTAATEREHGEIRIIDFDPERAHASVEIFVGGRRENAIISERDDVRAELR